MPQVLRQAGEEGGDVAQPIADLAPHAQHGQAPGLLEVPHICLRHVAVHEKVKSETAVEGGGAGLQALGYNASVSAVKSFKRILCADHEFYNGTHRRGGPPPDLVRQIVEGCLVGEGEEEKNGVHLLLTGLEDGTQV